MTEAVDLRSLRGRTVLVTGGSRGLGLYCARECVRAGANVVVAVRDPATALQAFGAGENISVEQLDLADLGSISRFCDAWGEHPVDVLLNCAGIMMAPQQWTVDGFESHFGVNHLGHFALTCRLALLVRDRVVTVSSPAHRFGRVDWDDLQWRRRRYRPFAAYAQSKLANLLFAAALGARLPVGARSLAAHPGWVRTGLVDDAAGWQGRAMRACTKAFARDLASGGGPLLTAMTVDVPDGSLVGPTRGAQFLGPPGVVLGSRLVSDPKTVERMWQVSAELTGVDAPLQTLQVAAETVAEASTYKGKKRRSPTVTNELSSPLDVAQAYHAAWTSGDLDGAMKYVSDDIIVHAPGDEISGKDGYSQYLGGFMKMLTGVTNLGAYGGEDGAMLFYCPHTPATKTAPTAEYFKISDGKITESTLLFDRPSFGPPQQ